MMLVLKIKQKKLNVKKGLSSMKIKKALVKSFDIAIRLIKLSVGNYY